MKTEKPVLVIALGNEFRSDDGIALALLNSLESKDHPWELYHLRGDCVDLLDLWNDRDVAVLDAMEVLDPTDIGTIHAFVPDTLRGFSLGPGTSSHALGLVEAWQLAEVLQKKPRNLLILAIGAERFNAGTELSTRLREAFHAIENQVEHRIHNFYTKVKGTECMNRQ